MKKFFKEFKEFITKGDAMSMAVGIIVGGAFTTIVNSLVNDIISPLIGLLTGGIDFSNVSFGIKDAQIMIGNFINAIITFLITAFALFIVVRAFNRAQKLADKVKKDLEKKEEEKKEEAEATPVIPEDIKLLSEIRDLLKK